MFSEFLHLMTPCWQRELKSFLQMLAFGPSERAESTHKTAVVLNKVLSQASYKLCSKMVGDESLHMVMTSRVDTASCYPL